MSAVFLIGLLPFPMGGGATSRLRSFALGLVEAGVPVEVFAYDSEEGGGVHPGERKGNWRGIPTWSYSHSRGAGSMRFRIKRVRWREDAAILARVERSCAERKVRAVVFYNQEPAIALRLLRICRRWKVAFVQQYAELHLRADIGHGVPWPHLLREHGHMQIIPRLADGAVVISRFLQQRCERIGRAPVLRVPALTSSELQPVLPRRSEAPFTLTYLGAGARRDCVPSLIEGFSIFHRSFKQSRMQILGLGGQVADGVRHDLLLRGLQHAVRVEHWKPVVELQAALGETDAFVLLRVDDGSSRACFPTRLPEFLLQGRPVLMNPVGDVAEMLAPDREYALVSSLAAEDIAAAMTVLARDPAKRRAIGCAGAAAGEREFGYRRWGLELAAFLDRITR